MKHATASKFYVVLAIALLFSASTSAAAAKSDKKAEETKSKPQEQTAVLRQAEGAKLRTLGNILQTVKGLRADEQRLTRQLKAARTEDEKTSISDDLKLTSQRASQLEDDFARIATGVNPADLASDTNAIGAYDWKSDLQDFLTPLFQELKDLTARPRNIAKLKREMAFYGQRRDLLASAVANLKSLADDTADNDLRDSLEKALKEWQLRQETEDNRLEYLKHQIEDLEKGKTSIWDSGQAVVKSFFKSRGRNLLLTILACFLFLTFMRMGRRYIYKWSPWHGQAERTFVARAIDLAWSVATVIGEISVVLGVLYVSEDWVLLSLAVIFLFGLLWTAKEGLTQFFEQFKLLMNLGAVREKEKVVYNGIPWMVSSINFYSTLSNPALSGASVRLPLSTLMGMVSRPFDPDEPWFPCKPGDWLMLSDGVFGRVAAQNPENVVMGLLGGASKTYPTPDFLSLAPLNLSGGFRLVEAFGVDYMHQEIVTKKIPEIMTAKVREALEAEGWGIYVVNVSSVFKTANSSSLDFEVICDFSGDGAQYYRGFQRVLNTCFVETATEHGWNIPFNTVTVKA